MRRKQAFLQFRNKSLNILLLEDKKTVTQTISLRELSREGLVSKLSALKNGHSVDTVLVIPREEVLSHEFDITGPAETFKRALYDRLEKSFPYRVEELSYGVRVMGEETERIKGVLLATTRAKLNESISPVEEAGLRLEEIIASDDALLYYFKENKALQSKKVLLFDLDGSSLECLLIEEGKLRLSKVLSLDTPELLREIGLLTIEFEGIERIYVAGRDDASLDSALQAQFQLPLERLATPVDSGNRPIPCSLYGAIHYKERQFLSLLPSDRKLKKKAEQRKRDLFQVSGAFLVFIGVLSALFFFHVKTLEAKLGRIEKEITSLKPKLDGVKFQHDVLKAADANFNANRETLSLFRELCLKIPPQVTLTRLSLGQREISLAGESTDNSSVADTLMLVKNLKEVVNPKLEFSRLKDNDLGSQKVKFEFLITAERSHG